MNKELVNKLNRIYDNAESSYNNNEIEVVQKGLIKVMNLSSNKNYNQFIEDAFDDLCLKPVAIIEQDLRSNIVDELDTDDEPLVAPDADDLAYLDKHDDVLDIANTDDVAEAPVLSDLKQVVDTVAKDVKDTKFQLN